MSKEEIKEEFIVTKYNYTYVRCKTCGGNGIKHREFRGMNFTSKCPTCNGKGKQKIIEAEDVSLEEALRIIESKKNKLT